MTQLLFDASIKIVKYVQSNNYNKLNEMNCLERVSEECIINTLKDYGGILDVVNEQEYMKYFQYIQIKKQNWFMTYLDMIIDGEKSQDYMCKSSFVFEKGKLYGIIGEHGSGGEAISLLLSNGIVLKEENIYIDDMEIGASDIKKYRRYEKIEDIVEDFHLTSGKLNQGLAKNSEWEKWRISLAVGFASNKKIYCFPWMDSLQFYDCMYNSSVFRLFKKLKHDGAIVIMPTSRKENVSGLADDIIQIHSPRFEKIISESSYFKKFYD